jgi:6-phosphofructokinase 1
MHIIGFRDGFRGLMENRTMALGGEALSGILTQGGTILGTSRDKPHKMPVGTKKMDMTDVLYENYRNLHLDVLVCLGGGGTQKNAFRLVERGFDIITLPKTIDNDVAETDTCFGFDTAMTIATDAIDRLHTTAHSHHRIIVVEVMGHNAGWLTLGAGLAGGADVVLIPEIPYDVERVAQGIRARSRAGKAFSIVAVAEGALSIDDAREAKAIGEQMTAATTKDERKQARKRRAAFDATLRGSTLRLSQQLEERTSLESRVTILGHLQRGGTPSAADRLLATRLGTACIDLVRKNQFGVMVAARGEGHEAVPLERVVGRRKLVPPEHPWLTSARDVGTSFGD